MYLTVGFAHAVESSCHERVILNGIAEDDKLCRTNAVAVCGLFGSFLDYLIKNEFFVPREKYGIYSSAAVELAAEKALLGENIGVFFAAEIIISDLESVVGALADT